jgi:hypoxanthine phosphoribosyltransferase
MQRNSEPLILTWKDFDRAVEVLAAGLEQSGAELIYAFPRGGYPLAVALSHRLEIPMAYAWKCAPEKVILVDDIVETGRTLRPYLGKPYHIVTWVAKGWTGNGVNYLLRAHPNQWVVFPWEKQSMWQTEAQSFNLSRHGQ